MNNKNNVLIIFVLLLVLIGCKNEKTTNTEISDEETLDYDGYFTIYEKSLGGTIDSIKIVNGKGAINWDTDDKLIASIYNNELDQHWAHKVILEKGTITVTVTKDTAIIVGGTPNNMALATLERKKEPLRLAMHKLQADHQDFRGLSAEDSLKLIETNREKSIPMAEEWRKLQLDFALENNHLAGLVYVGFNLNKFSLDELKTLVDNYKDYADNPSYRSLKRYYEGAKRTAVGVEAPGYTLPNINGEKMTLSSKQGNIVLLDFWASWCAPCRKSIPHLKEMNERFKDKGLEIVSISIDKDSLAWRKAVKEEAMPWDQLLDNKLDASNKYAIISIPQLYILDEQGVIIAKNVRDETLTKKLEELFSP